MRLLQIYIPELGTNVKFKQFPPEAVIEFTNNAHDQELTPVDYKQLVIDNFVFNVKTEILRLIRMLKKQDQNSIVEALYNGAVMLNPGLDIDRWVALSFKINDYAEAQENQPPPEQNPQRQLPKARPKKITRAKFMGMEKYLKDRIIGQDEAVDAVISALKRSLAGLGDDHRPIGIFLLAGASGVGKTHLAKSVHQYLFSDHEIIRIDCGEYRERHQAVSLLGAPKSYVGYEDGSVFAKKVRAAPNSVILLDEVEKAHPEFWNVFLRIFDEGKMTDSKGKEVDFTKSIIMMTTNLGNDKVVDLMTGRSAGFTARTEVATQTTQVPPRASVEATANDAIKKQFKPEFLNRIDKKIIFNFLSGDDFRIIAELELEKTHNKLAKKGINLQFDDSVIDGLIDLGVDTVSNARGMSQIRRDQIEDILADLMMGPRAPVRGTIIDMFYNRVEGFYAEVIRPTKKAKAAG